MRQEITAVKLRLDRQNKRRWIPVINGTEVGQPGGYNTREEAENAASKILRNLAESS